MKSFPPTAPLPDQKEVTEEEEEAADKREEKVERWDHVPPDRGGIVDDDAAS